MSFLSFDLDFTFDLDLSEVHETWFNGLAMQETIEIDT